ncbi:hypothetical protein [Amycolatopsis saalfeldensis]|uniref:Uncharacterized protein n=1 Tax=Amycolatopsis saalfeldensis TaxID=394193 RepID=A0A1H8PQ38_9PSEU|nr:hypothetical protein [Amycolatopsis saalfeldensis]SEO44035.1 hypothetical protein SAMN04489732_10126 [Amycolatopsis saalfeldensis]
MKLSPRDEIRLWQKAVKLTREAEAVWAVRGPRGFTGRRDSARFMRVALRAETALFRLACVDVDDLGPRFAYGTILSRRSATSLQAEGWMLARSALAGARGALWAFDRSGISVGEPDRIRSLAEAPPVEFPLLTKDGVNGIVHGDDRLASAANARLELADRLVRFGPSPGRDELTPEVLDATFRVRDPIGAVEQSLAEKCRVASCRGHGPEAEARILVAEAELVYRVLADLGGRYGPDDLKTARERGALVLKQLPLR